MKPISRFASLILALVLCAHCPTVSFADDASSVVRDPTSSADVAVPAAAIPDNAPFDVEAKSAVLMELSTGTVLYAKNANEPLPPASVTKVMTLLLAMEALDSNMFTLTHKVQVSEYAASMGGSQVFLKAGESISVEDLIKSTVIASANDAAVTLAELVSGSAEAFVARMNERAAELSLESTHFENPTGLDDTVTNHVTSAYDVAVMTRELSKHPKIFEYSSIWMDSIRGGEFVLTNTNRLVRFYNGATGLKTGSTDAAGFCVSATAKRDGMHLCAVIMGSATKDERNAAAKKLLDWGFANFFLYHADAGAAGDVAVTGSAADSIPTEYAAFEGLFASSMRGKILQSGELPENVAAPVKAGDAVGRVIWTADGSIVGETPVRAAANAPRITFGQLFARFVAAMFLR